MLASRNLAPATGTFVFEGRVDVRLTRAALDRPARGDAACREAVLVADIEGVAVADRECVLTVIVRHDTRAVVGADRADQRLRERACPGCSGEDVTLLLGDRIGELDQGGREVGAGLLRYAVGIRADIDAWVAPFQVPIRFGGSWARAPPAASAMRPEKAAMQAMRAMLDMR